MKDIKEIYEKYSIHVYRYLILLTKDEHLSEELTQETFYQAIKNINHFNGQCSIYTWLCSIAKNSYKAYIRKNKKYMYLDEIESLSKPVESDSGLYHTIVKLKSPYREIVQLHIYDGFTLKEIGKMLGKSESYARVMFHRAKELLRKEIVNDEM